VALSFGDAAILPTLRDAGSGVLATARSSGPLLRAPVASAALAKGEDREPVRIAPAQTMRLAGIPWRDGYCKFFLPHSPVWGWFRADAVHWGSAPR
jgi:hypothetical protein